MAEETVTQLKPPFGNVEWYKKFFELIQQRAFDKFDKEIIELNIVKRANATMVFNGLRFLGLVKDDGTVTEKFESLRRKGNEFKENLKIVVKEGYSHLFSKIVLSNANADTFYNYFTEYFGCSAQAAASSTKIFIYLCQEAGIELPSELTESELKVERKGGKKKDKQQRQEKKKDSGKQNLTDMHESKWGDDILLYLKKGDRKTREKIAKFAKRLIDMYVEEADEE